MSTAYKYIMFCSLCIMSYFLISLGIKDGIPILLLSVITMISLVVLSLFIHTVRTWIVIKKEQVGNIIFTRISIISAAWFIYVFTLLAKDMD